MFFYKTGIHNHQPQVSVLLPKVESFPIFNLGEKTSALGKTLETPPF
jgi:hypothetical protein